ncbi:MAG TPA: HAMP domain-containing sensor histidine kinase [Bacteroidia bacterium]|nr:HAMP domain-containing sensor histidine kinase [Bacteroidia bacterium]
MKPYKLLLLFLAPVLLVLLAQVLSDKEAQRRDVHQVAVKAGEQLSQLELQTDEYADKLNVQWQERNPSKPFETNVPGEVVALVFDGDSLVWWSGSGIPLDSPQAAIRSNKRLVKAGNGWYELFSRSKHGITAAAFLRIRSDYPFQNKYLVNAYHPGLCIPRDFHFSPVAGKGEAVTDRTGQPLFYIEASPSGNPASPIRVTVLAYLLAILLFHIFVYYLVRSLKGSKGLAWFVVGLLIIISRYAGSRLGWPQLLHEYSFFSPQWYASSKLLNSLADLFAFSAGLCCFAIGLSFALKNKTGAKAAAMGMGPLAVMVIFSFAFAWFTAQLISSLILNSKITFNVTNVFDFDFFTLAGVVIIGLLLTALVWIIFAVAGQLKVKTTGHKLPAFIIFSTAIGSFLILFAASECDTVNTGIILLTLLIYGVVFSNKSEENYILKAGAVLLISACCSIYAAVTISNLNALREKSERKLVAAKLENEQDGIAEYLFDDIARKVEQDKILADYFSASFRDQLMTYATDDPITKRMQQAYFTGYWARYDVSVKCFSSDGLPVNAGGDPTWNLDYFNLLIKEEGLPTQNRQLYFLGNNAGQLSYIARFEINDTNSDNPAVAGTIIVFLKSKMLREDSGFPELLISDKVPRRKELSDYSIANYRDNQLINQSGPYNYLNNGAAYLSKTDTTLNEQFIEYDGYSHLIYKKAGGGVLIISTLTPGLLAYISLFSYLFALSGAVFMSGFFIQRLIRARGKVHLNLKTRIQSSVVLIVLTGMLLIGGATVYFIYNNYVNKLNDAVTEKLKSVRSSITELPGVRNGDKSISEEMGYALSGIGATLSANFNIYSTDGKLLFSTQSKLYDQGIIAPLMERQAMDELNVSGRSFHSRLEKAGKLKYLSAYLQLRDLDNKVTGYVNLPYYARQEELNREISTFLIALINIYVLLFSVSLLIAFIISDRITNPLQLIQQSLARIRLGASNETIRYNHPDEIGALVREYNRMVNELAESAGRLARSERESAWREMAKQVAHEIKNPLTPMKLSVQHLQRAYKENHPNLEAMVKRVSETLIDQIETLSHIANEFSNFAQMPKGNNIELDLLPAIKSVVDLYVDSDNATVTFSSSVAETAKVFADKDQLSRVFSNLLKNAVQSIPDNKKGNIDVHVSADETHIKISIADNGIGIPESRKAVLFTPNFTTKTGGTGLGLAMSKNIIEQSGGTIWFESEENKGTVFYIRLPRIK